MKTQFKSLLSLGCIAFTIYGSEPSFIIRRAVDSKAEADDSRSFKPTVLEISKALPAGDEILWGVESNEIRSVAWVGSDSTIYLYQTSLLEKKTRRQLTSALTFLDKTGRKINGQAPLGGSRQERQPKLVSVLRNPPQLNIKFHSVTEGFGVECYELIAPGEAVFFVEVKVLSMTEGDKKWQTEFTLTLPADRWKPMISPSSPNTTKP